MSGVAQAQVAKAAVLRQSGVRGPYVETRPLSFEQVTVEPPGFGEIQVRIRAASLCHSDCRLSTAIALGLFPW